MNYAGENAKLNTWEHIDLYTCVIPRQKCPGNLVLSILEYTGIYWNFISLLLYEPCVTVPVVEGYYF